MPEGPEVTIVTKQLNGLVQNKIIQVVILKKNLADLRIM